MTRLLLRAGPVLLRVGLGALLAALLALAVLPTHPVFAQKPSDGTTPTQALTPEVRAGRAKLDAFKVELDQKEAALQREGLRDEELQQIRQQLDPVTESIRGLVDEFGPRLDAARARLEQLGPKPKEEEPEESADLARERGEREAAAAEIDDTQRLGRALLVQAEQLTSQVSDRRRSAFTRALFQRGSGLLSPDLWGSVLATLPRDWAALELVAADWAARVERQATPVRLLLVGLAVGVAVALYVARRHLAPRLVARDPQAVEVPRRRRLVAAGGILLVGAGLAAAGSYVVHAALDLFSMLPPRLAPFVGSVLAGLAFVALVQALCDALLSPGRPAWRLVTLSDAAAARTTRVLVALASVIAVGKAVEALNRAIAAGLSMTVATKGLFAVVAALILAELLRRFASTAAVEEECLGPYVPQEAEVGGPVRGLGWAAVAGVVGAAVAGYAALAAFLVDQIAWLGILLGLLALAIMAADEFIGGTLKGQTRVATALQANTGLRRRSLQQIGVLATGLARVVLILAAALLALAPWGVDSADVLSSVRAAFFGFKVGDVTVSFSSIAIALLIFALGFAATRIVKRWLDTAFLPATDLDAGLRNSISTVVGYVGVIVAGAAAFSYLGLSLDKLAIVAGALSVGIGFGLQSIVNNFVSGLILLWERPIRVGDLVVVGDGEGHVRRINVRATEIETFDRSTVIVPNSNLISGVVKNRVRGDRVGRVVVPVNVMRAADPVRAAEILMECAGGHADVLKEPAPKVFFKKIGDANLEFEVICFVADVDLAARTLSELNFAVFQCLSKEGIIPPPAAPVLEVRGLQPVGEGLAQIAQAIDQAERRESESGQPRPRGPRRALAGGTEA